MAKVYIEESELTAAANAIRTKTETTNKIAPAAMAEAIMSIDNQKDYTHQLKRNTAYKVGDIAYSTKLPSWAYLECTTAGTTGDSEPDMSGVTNSEVKA